METAIKEKHRLEEAQRARRKVHEKAGTKQMPAYFEYERIGVSNEMGYIFNGKYWDDRKTKNWDKLVHIYD